MGCCSTFGKFLTVILYLAGIGLSGYAYFIEISKEKDVNYVALCEISENMNCTKVLTSKWAKGFGLVAPTLGEDHPLNQPNCLYGIVFYSVMGLLFICGRNNRFIATLQLFSLFISCLMSVYLAFILYAILKDLCVVCVATYGINFLLFALSYCNRCSIRPSKRPTSRRDEPILGNFKKNI